MHIWNSKTTTYYDKGKKAYGNGDVLPQEVIAGMGEETFAEYSARGLIISGVAPVVVKKDVVQVKKKAVTDIRTADEIERDRLLQVAEGYGLKPHYRAGIPKLRAMIDDHEALQSLKEEALVMGIKPRDDMTFEELTVLVEEKRADCLKDEAFEALQKEALRLNIEDFEHLPFDELTELIDLTKSEAANEPDH